MLLFILKLKIKFKYFFINMKVCCVRIWMYIKKNIIRIDFEKFINFFKINYVCKELYIDLEMYV